MNQSPVIAASLLVLGCASGGEMTDRLDYLMRDYSGDVPGASVLVVRDGEPVVRRSWGLADIEQGTPASPETNYRLASLTKQFTAAAVLLLVEDGRLGLDDSVRKWLPSLPSSAEPVTIRNLLTHTSGLVDYEDLLPESSAEQIRDADVLRLLEPVDELYFEPGSRYQYSNSSYALLALIIERASETSFADFLQKRIFEALRMSGSLVYEKDRASVPHRAFGHGRTPEGWKRDDQSTTSAVLGDGGVYSSVADLVRWDAALYDDRLLSAESRRLLFTPAIETDRPAGSYGFGWRIRGDTVWHAGKTRGFHNAIVRKPSERTTVVVLTNRDGGAPYELALEVLRMFD